ncbi:hypothetical protein [Paractinoplanes lichenicola]|uniref:Universal stress protein n=1 Tax=Paractinoplanes lichenicola TaxID=2802976 RepID=A0ABS1W1Q1_9ACTN|nr:hypothetical protein [Actinoplanes lichenicola]MBL7260663.1 hypothetical protein [Actinoplanes lichenicola]
MRVGLTGHQRLSLSTRRTITSSIAGILTEQSDENLVGITSLAEGADQLFAFTVLATGGRLHAIIPSSDYESSFQDDQAARANYTALCGLANDITTLPFAKPGEDAYLAAGKAVVDNCDLLIAVWDGKPAVGRGGTGDIVRYANERSVDVKVIWPRGAQRI